MSADAMLGWLLTYAVHSTVVLCGAWLVTRRRSLGPAVREVIWKAALVTGLITSTVQSADWLPTWRQYSVPNGTRPVVKSAVKHAPLPRHADKDISEPVPAEIVPAVASTRIEWPVAVVGIWSAIAGLLTLGFGWRRWQLARRLGARHLCRDHAVIADLTALRHAAGHRRPVDLTVSSRLASPIAVGVSEICVPTKALRELDDHERVSMLAHELAHLIRLDTVWLAVAAVMERVFFFQPLNRVARVAIQSDAELLCDEWAADRTGSPITMAKCLVKVAEWIDAGPRPIPVAGMAEERSQLVQRVQRLVEEGPMSTKPRRRVVVAGIAGLVIGAAVIVPNVVLRGQELDPGRLVAGAAAADTGEAVVTALIGALRDESTEVRQAAARSLGQLKSRRATSALAAVVGDENAEVREAVTRALADLEDPNAVNALMSRRDDPVADIRKAAIDGLSELHESVKAEVFRPWLSDSDPEARSQAARALGHYKDKASVAALVAIANDPNADVRQAVIDALGEIGDPSAIPAITAALKDSKTDVRQQALNALSNFELEQSPAGIVELLADPNANVRQAAANLVGHFHEVRAVPALRKLLTDADADVRESAVEALSEIRDQAAIEALMAGLKSNDAVVRKAAAEALGRRGES